VKRIGEIAEAKGATPAQVALGWLLAQKPWIVPIPGTTKKHRMEENAGGADVELTTDDLGSLADLLAQVPVTGERYTPAMQATIDR
jgi:aryl-alcohol dehydrogenase-like predicted oxidoreductase